VYRFFGSDVLAAETTESAPEAPPSPEGIEVFLRIDGMHCSSCELLIERTAIKVDGILSAASSYATSTAKIVYDPNRIDESELPEVLNLAGYRARLRTDNVPEFDERQSLLRLLTGGVLAIMVMMLYIAFFYPTYLGLVELRQLDPVDWLASKAVPGAMLVLTSILIFYVGAPILRGAWIGLRARALNMDNLLAIAILAAYGYSVGQLVVGSLDLYFDVATVVVVVVTIGRHLEQRAKARATSELTNTIEAWNPTARIRKDGELQIQTVDDLKPGDHIVIWEREPIPVDGTVIDGQGAIDESLMTGEPFPVTRGPGEDVLGGTVVIEGTLEIEVGPTVESRMDNLARILWNIQSSTSGIQGMADRIAGVFVPVVLVLSALVTGWFLLGGAQPGYALLAGLATLIVSCPCTFGLAIPLTTAAGVSTALRHGIIVTSADAFEKAPRVDIVAIDKTGTLTTGEMTVVEVLGPPTIAEYAAAVERLSSHPIAEAIARLDSRRTATDFEIHPGKGAVATVDDRLVAVGSKSLFMTLGWDIPYRLTTLVAASTPGERVVSYVGWSGSTHGAIVTRDQPRPEWERVVDLLRENSRVVLLTGAEHSSGYEDRVDQVYAGIPPEGKAAVIRRLRIDGTVAMIGDGSNDAPALAAADLGFAFGAPTALAADAADVVIPGDRLDRIFDAFYLIDTIRRRVRQNIGWALLYNMTAIPLAMTGLLNPLFAALAMSASSLLVVWNSSRLIGSAESTSPLIGATSTTPNLSG
jgi:P-type Cu2+ transporter